MNKEESNIGHICIQDLADYNNGKLRFEWIDLTDYDSLEELQDYIKEFLGEHEEIMVADYDDFPDLGEYPNWETLWEIHEYIQSNNHIDSEAIEGWLSNGMDWDESSFEDSYSGKWNSFQEYAEDFADDCVIYEVPENLRCYFDYERFARDLEMDYWTHTTTDGSEHIYRNY